MKAECRTIADDLLELDDRLAKAYFVAEHRHYSELPTATKSIIQQLDVIKKRLPAGEALSDKEIEAFKDIVENAPKYLEDTKEVGRYFTVMNSMMDMTHHLAVERACRCESSNPPENPIILSFGEPLPPPKPRRKALSWYVGD